MLSLLLYVGLAALLGSVPTGWTSVLGFSLESGPLFRALTGLPRVDLSPSGSSRTLGALLVLLWALWLAAVVVWQRLSPAARGRAHTLVVSGGVAMLALVVVLVPPVLSADLYRQASYGHMVARWGLNPYAVRAVDVAGNPLLPFATQTQITTIYGPAYTLLSAFAATLSPPTPLGAALAWKTLSALAALGTALLAAPLARALDDARSDAGLATLLLLWNPLVIVESAGAGHIEPVMMLPAVAGMLLVLRKRPVPGTAMLVVSVLTKWVTGLLLALVLLREARGAAPGRRGRTLLRLAGVALLTAGCCYAPFATGLFARGGVHELAIHGGAPLGNPTRSWLPEWVVVLAFAALVAAVARPAVRGGWPRLLAATALLMLVFIVVVVPWLFPWYLIAPLVLAAVLPRSPRGFAMRLLCFGLGAVLMLHYARLVPCGDYPGLCAAIRTCWT
ncbi:MAG: hypothetical protein JXP73_12300 [Deltaproteobacteria bacterium]|nr:hypothetical protein [Deltaproteobacteria bacterium]